ncbi:hypothetical protein RI845_12630 [Thalassotalea nanhaiensis]|uniref:DUF695 domain-containing protein n=1 Tax=Thalassotalea nanhaiensis TaxID=3065648 RepID=A0ABY9TF18_9GAMM|nr:hypothetical protein RI845_12630 [Colwelliaceae bacterium SQ345]
MDRRYKMRIERYWNKMEKQADEALSKLDFNEWFDLWHTHPDWDGKGNSRPENRQRASTLTIQLLQKVEDLSGNSKKTIQCFAIVCEDTMENSVYIHSENPNGSQFPFLFEDVNWSQKVDELESIINKELYEYGVFNKDDSQTYFIRKKS